jgi:CRP/FNR family cyclic AMP-dependent transcriptional regulator
MAEARGTPAFYSPEHLWELLDERQRAVLDNAGTRHQHRAGTTLLREGEPAGSALVLPSRRAKVLATGSSGYKSVLAVRVPGDVLGEFAAIDGKPRSATVVTVDPVCVLRLPAARFNAILTKHPGIAHVLFKVVISRLRIANLRRVEFGETTVAQRLTRTLAELAFEHGEVEAQDIAIALPFGQEDLANMVAGSREAVVRALRVLRDEGTISTGRRKITIRQPEVLGLCASSPCPSYPRVGAG